MVERQIHSIKIKDVGKYVKPDPAKACHLVLHGASAKMSELIFPSRAKRKTKPTLVRVSARMRGTFSHPFSYSVRTSFATRTQHANR